MSVAPLIMAHRGFRELYPENTLLALRKAVEAGADGVEFDVQMTADQVPVILHDADLERTTGEKGLVFDLASDQVLATSAHEPGRFAERFRGETIPRLSDVNAVLENAPGVLAFIEIKTESLERCDIPAFVERVLDETALLGARRVILCDDARVLQQARSMAEVPVGWVIHRHDTAELERAHTLAPDYLFCRDIRLPPGATPLEAGSWEWAVYEVNDPEALPALVKRGVRWVETASVARLRDSLAGAGGRTV